MSDYEDDLVELPNEIKEITQEEAEARPELRADPSKAPEGIRDDEDPANFEELEAEAAEAVVLEDEEEAGGAGGGGGAGAGEGGGLRPHLRRALALGVSQKGMREHPRGSNKNKYSRYFGFGPQFWCADFVSYCLDKTGNEDHKAPWGYPSAVENITAWGQKHGRIHSNPKRGDIFTRKDGEHTGFVLSVQGSTFMTIEGNTTEAGSSDPDKAFFVASHARNVSDGLYFFVRFRD
jgi:CHAP domain